jgi:hypothetical protein
MGVRINNILWTIDTTREFALARIMGNQIAIRRSCMTVDPRKPFQVWVAGIPASAAGVLPFYRTANEAAQYLSRMSPGDFANLVEHAEEMDLWAE